MEGRRMNASEHGAYGATAIKIAILISLAVFWLIKKDAPEWMPTLVGVLLFALFIFVMSMLNGR
jgi:hypothetical protein